MKDRMALAAIEGAEADGRLKAGGVVVEYTSGTTGVSLAAVCAARGYGLKVVFSDAFSEEKALMMNALGAQIVLVPSEDKRITESLIKRMIDRAEGLSREPAHWWCDQLNNEDAVKGYLSMGEEIWQQSGGRIDAFVQSVGTAHSILGAAQALRRHRSGIRVVAVEPAESAVLSGQPSGAHTIEGIGIGFLPPLWNPREVDEIIPVSSEEAKAMARRLAREEGAFGGTSSGANVVAALRIAERLGSGATVATVIVDSGLRYLSTDLYRAAEA
jgi:cysteine synthase A